MSRDPANQIARKKPKWAGPRGLGSDKNTADTGLEQVGAVRISQVSGGFTAVARAVLTGKLCRSAVLCQRDM